MYLCVLNVLNITISDGNTFISSGISFLLLQFHGFHTAVPQSMWIWLLHWVLPLSRFDFTHLHLPVLKYIDSFPWRAINDFNSAWWRSRNLLSFLPLTAVAYLEPQNSQRSYFNCSELFLQSMSLICVTAFLPSFYLLWGSGLSMNLERLPSRSIKEI